MLRVLALRTVNVLIMPSFALCVPSATRGYPPEQAEGGFSDWGRGRGRQGQDRGRNHPGELPEGKEESSMVREFYGAGRTHRDPFMCFVFRCMSGYTEHVWAGLC